VALDAGVKVPIGHRVAEDAVDHVVVSIRPEKIALRPDGAHAGPVSFAGVVVESVYLGASTRYTVRSDSGLQLTADQPHAAGSHDRAFALGAHVTVGWHPDDSVVLADHH
jgi:spermidine/putrescine transport system ATP-binding protein